MIHTTPSNDSFECFVIVPCSFGMPTMVLAAMRGGAIGFLDLEFSGASEDLPLLARDQLRWMFEHAPMHGRLGLRVPSAYCADVATLLTQMGAEDFDLIFTDPYTAAADIARVAALRGVRCFVEIRSSASLLVLPSIAQLDGVIAFGGENGGIVAQEGTFILLQKLVSYGRLPVYARGGIGLHTAAGCRAVGAKGVVLDNQLLLTEESPFPAAWREHLVKVTGHDTIVVGLHTGWPCRILNRPSFAATAALISHSQSALVDKQQLLAWSSQLRKLVGWLAPSETVWPIGQSIGIAHHLQQYRSVERIVRMILGESARSIKMAVHQRALGPGAHLAQSHGTKYPIVQGPMTRVSDRPGFALSVAQAGGLPLVALALLRGSEVRPILDATLQQVGALPWGVGLLGFVPPDLRREQLAEVVRAKPRFALIAGARADMALELEQAGIATYVHTPALSLLSRFFAKGLRRFVFEGRECGGHVGPIFSLPLWESVVTLLSEATTPTTNGKLHLLFAGGIHDAYSGAFIAAMAACLVEEGLLIGVLMGTAYLFTSEAVSSGAIVKRYQQEAITCTQTILLTSSAGHDIRVADTRFAAAFDQRRKQLIEHGTPADDMRITLERMMLGRMRLASKGLIREHDGSLAEADDVTQINEGIYMLGQVAALRASVCSVAELHEEVSEGGLKLLENSQTHSSEESAREGTRANDVAIIGMSLMLPGANTRVKFWHNLLSGVQSIKQIPLDRWDVSLYFDPNPSAKDKTYSQWGGFIDDVLFEPMSHRIPPHTMPNISVSQLLALELARLAIEDAGYVERPFDRENTGVILGADESSPLSERLRCRSTLPQIVHPSDENLLLQLPEWSAETLPGVLSNVVAGRVANDLDLGGPNFVVNAACASSLVALELAVRELRSRRSNMVLAGGVNATQTPFFYVGFSKTQALSPKGSAAVFDQHADGIVLSEGACIVVLKRLEDALRDKDRVYAIIKGTGGSSDGRGGGITAPTVSGQKRAVTRALADAGIDPNTLGLYEAHGTGTPLGDRTELQTMRGVLEEGGAASGSCAVGSVKSLIGHTQLAAGVAGVAKAALALYHKVLPPHFGVTDPINAIADPQSPLYLLDQPRPWLKNRDGGPRRAAVSAFGFGGTNSHLILESSVLSETAPLGAEEWPCELLLFKAQDEQHLVKQLDLVIGVLERGAAPSLRDLAFTLALEAENLTSGPSLAIVTGSARDLCAALNLGRAALSSKGISLPAHILLSRSTEASIQRVAFLFPGQGSQYPNMGREHATYLPDFREAVERCDSELMGVYGQPLSAIIFPTTAFTQEQREAQRLRLADTHYTQPALGTISIGFLHLLNRLGVCSEIVAGHSYGELTALYAAGVYSQRTLLKLSEVRGRAMRQSTKAGGMLSVQAARETVEDVISGMAELVIANHNSPQQTVIAGPLAKLEEAKGAFSSRDIRATSLSVSGPFHSPSMDSALGPWRNALEQAELRTPASAVYSNLDGSRYPLSVEDIRRQLEFHLSRPVEFVKQVANMYRDGARCFIELGPGTVLSSLVNACLKDQTHLCVSLDPTRGKLEGLLRALATLVTNGLVARPSRLFDGRGANVLSLAELRANKTTASASSSAWLVNGSHARPANKTTTIRTRSQDRTSRIPSLSPTMTVGSSLDSVGAISIVDEALYKGTNKQNRSKNMDGSSQDTLGDIDMMNEAPQNKGKAQQRTTDLLKAYTGHLETMALFLRVQQASFATLCESTRHVSADDTRAPSGETLTHSSFFTPSSSHIFADDVTIAHAGRAEGVDDVASLKDQRSTLFQVDEAVLEDTQSQQRGDTTPPSTDILDRQLPAPSDADKSKISNVALLETDTQHRTDTSDSSHDVTAELVAIVSEYTGYPTEMLRLDLDIEAELGIDSLRRMEIAEACLTRLIKSRGEVAPPELQDSLIRARTLQQMIAALQPTNSQPSTSDSFMSSVSSAPTAQPSDTSCRRSCFVGRPVPLDEGGDTSTPDTVLIIEDGVGIAQLVTRHLQELGVSVIGITQEEASEPDILRRRLTSLSMPRLDAILHLAPLMEAPLPHDLIEWRRLTQTQAKSLFQVLSFWSSQQEGRRRPITVISGSGLGGSYGRTVPPIDSLPIGGAPVGLLKCLALEIPGAITKSLDFALSQDYEAIAHLVVEELLHHDGHTEIGYPMGIRTVYAASVSPLLQSHKGEYLTPDADWVVLATGGARGITAEILHGFALKGMTLIVVGSQDYIREEEASLSTARTPAELRSHLLSALPDNARATPTQVEAAIMAIQRSREIRTNLALLRGRGIDVIYIVCDLTNQNAVGELIHGILSRYKRIDAVLHGAGIIEDKLIRDKTWSSFDRVFDTKVDSTYLLFNNLDKTNMKLFVLFGSVAGRIGNPGQSDYAAANEVLNRFAWWLTSRWPNRRTVCINWGPWASPGMATPAVLAALQKRGISPIAPSDGVRFFTEEISYGTHDDAELLASAVSS